MRGGILSTRKMQGTNHRRWPAIGIVLVLSFFCHDIAMAGTVHRIDDDPQVSALEQQPSVLSEPDVSSSFPEKSCDADRQAARTSTQYCPIIWTSSGVSEEAITLEVQPPPGLDATIPPLSSAVRRALLQVYLN